MLRGGLVRSVRRRTFGRDRAAVRHYGHRGRSGQLHYLCYDSAKFDAIREQGATATFRGAIVISHGFTEFAEKYDELVWYFLLAGYSVCVLEHRGHGKSARDVDNRCMVWIDDWQRYVPIWPASPKPSASSTRPACR